MKLKNDHFLVSRSKNERSSKNFAFLDPLTKIFLFFWANPALRENSRRAIGFVKDWKSLPQKTKKSLVISFFKHAQKCTKDRKSFDIFRAILFLVLEIFGKNLKGSILEAKDRKSLAPFFVSTFGDWKSPKGPKMFGRIENLPTFFGQSFF